MSGIRTSVEVSQIKAILEEKFSKYAHLGYSVRVLNEPVITGVIQLLSYEPKIRALPYIGISYDIEIEEFGLFISPAYFDIRASLGCMNFSVNKAFSSTVLVFSKESFSVKNFEEFIEHLFNLMFSKE